MTQIPQVKRLAIRLTADAERQVRAGHPWVFDRSVERIKGEGTAGDLGLVFDRKKNKLLAIGLYDPESPIRLRIIHLGKPTTIDRTFWQRKLEKAIDLRQSSLPPKGENKQAVDTLKHPTDRTLGGPAITGYRLLHGENDGFPGLVVDRYAQVLVVKVYSAVWRPWLATIIAEILDKFPDATVVMRLSRQLQSRSDLPEGWGEGRVLHGRLEDEEVIFQEYGLSFRANPIHGHKTGFFLDHRHNRKRVGELARGKRVLDLFSYVGGFSVHALAGGAREVVSLDINPQAQAAASEHVRLNGLDESRHRALVGDAFELLRKLQTAGEKFDLIVSDPPSFAKKADERTGAMRAYRRLARAVIPLVAEGGIYLAASCSARITADEFYDLQTEELRKSGRSFNELERSRHDFDHPIGFAEGAYLKSVYFQL